MGNLTISDSTISGQHATFAANQGGAIVKTSGGTATLTNTTISGNSSQANGGGIFQNSGTLNLRNVTIAFNSADSDEGGTAGDGGGVFASGGTVNVRNSIIADNLDLTGAPPAHPDCSGTIVSEGYNLIEDTTGCTVTGDLTGNVLGMQPMLAALDLNGGPTATHRFPSGAPADNAGNPAQPGSGGTSCEATDQRGYPRNATTGQCDIGAYERQPPVLDPIGDKTVQAGQTLTFGVGAVDPDPGENLLFSGSNLPAGASVDPGEFNWTPSEAQVGSHPNVTISVSDGSLSDSEAITITVTAVPGPPGPGPDPVQPKAKRKKCKKGFKLKKIKRKGKKPRKKCVRKKKRRKRK